MSHPVDVLGSSVRHLEKIVEELEPGQLDSSAYPSEWTIAEVLSHIGSGAVILQRRLEDTLAGTETPADFAPRVWDEWNAKSSAAMAADALQVDREFLERLASLSETERAGFRFAMGPLTEDFAGFVGLRLSEHALHTWDIEVVVDPGATLPAGAVGVVIDRLELIARFTGIPAETDRRVTIRTTDPPRDFSLVRGPEEVLLTSSEGAGAPDIELSAEAFIRLVYGRLDPEHAPPIPARAELDALRRTFPGP